MLLKVLFCGHTAAHCNDVSCLKGLCKQSDLDVTVLDPARFVVPGHGIAARALRRMTVAVSYWLLRSALSRQAQQADVVLTFKGQAIDALTLQAIQAAGTPCVNYFPDGHPHAYGARLKAALNEYDLIVSAKADHPVRWSQEFGYTNRCVHVPHGYDPELHLFSDLVDPADQTLDMVIVATARDEYFRLLEDMLAEAPELADRKVLIGGPGWRRYRSSLPKGWQFPGAQFGADYTAALRSAGMVIAPVQRSIVIDGRNVPYDADSARTYELAAMGVFFVHRHSDLMPQIFDPEHEVPLFRNGRQLAQLARTYLDQPELRTRMAREARARAIPAYSWDARAAELAAHLRGVVVDSRVATTSQP